MTISDDIGTRGEALFFVLLTQFCGRSRPFFRPHFLGDKFATLDYLVELLDAGPSTPFFFVQVKTTSQGYTQNKKGERRLKTKVSRKDMGRLRLYPAPTYVIGIDEREERGYIMSANEGSPLRISSLPTTFPLDCRNLSALWHEVKGFWEERDMRLLKSTFTVN
jgi:hypothetical protein